MLYANFFYWIYVHNKYLVASIYIFRSVSKFSNIIIAIASYHRVNEVSKCFIHIKFSIISVQIFSRVTVYSNFRILRNILHETKALDCWYNLYVGKRKIFEQTHRKVYKKILRFLGYFSNLVSRSIPYCNNSSFGITITRYLAQLSVWFIITLLFRLIIFCSLVSMFYI